MAEVQRAQSGPARHPARPKPRPLSPHLSIYRPLINMVMSIFHRITGVILYLGSLLLALWLIAADLDRGLFEFVNGWLGSWPGLVVLMGFTWAFLHHLFGGIRHMIWDSGRGFDLVTATRMSWATLIASLFGTALIWLVKFIV